jgi:UDP-N-acetylglucosamine/UDP-N-acetylgalactosamine diphosphorylase
LQELSEISTKKSGGKIMMYIMTSEHTKRPTEEFFENHNFFGLEKTQVTEILLYNYGTLLFQMID